MDHLDFINLLENDHYSPADLEAIQDVCRNYPMFNLAHMLKVRIKQALGHDRDADLKVAAVYASDRKTLHHMVTGVNPPAMPEGEALQGSDSFAENSQGLQFSEDSQQEADLIIEQHAPYAASSGETELLELDEETTEDQEAPEDLIGAVVKDETDMEEPGPDDTGTPSADIVEPEEDEQEAEDEPVDESGEEPDHGRKLIRDFIQQEPGPIRADNKTSLTGDVSLSSTKEHDGLITDTLAQIYVKQGLYAKAIYAYERLSLKYPEKSAYFAAQIDKIKNINQ